MRNIDSNVEKLNVELERIKRYLYRLEEEHRKGNIEDKTYETLRTEYQLETERLKNEIEKLNTQQLYEDLLHYYSLIWGFGSASTKPKLEKDISKLMEKGMTRKEALISLYNTLNIKRNFKGRTSN
jgi:predicted transcriptional regulator